MITYLMPLIEYALVECRVTNYILSNAKEGSFKARASQGVEHKRRSSWMRPIIKGQVQDAFLGIDAPDPFWITPAKPGRGSVKIKPHRPQR